MALAHDFKTAGSENRATVLQICAYRREDELVLSIRSEFLRIRTGHHFLDNDWRRPRLYVGQTVFRQLGVAVRIRRRLGLLGLLFCRQRRVQKRIHRLLAIGAAYRRIVLLRLLTPLELLSSAEKLLSAARLWRLRSGLRRILRTAFRGHRACEYV